MDWPKARTILLIAFAVLNLMLVLMLGLPVGNYAGMGRSLTSQQIDELRRTLAEQGLELPPSQGIPRAPSGMRFLHVVYAQPTTDALNGVVDSRTKAAVYRFMAIGPAAQPVNLDKPRQAQSVVETFLHQTSLLPTGAQFSGVFQGSDKRIVIVEYVPTYGEYPVFSGYVRAEVSSRGIETVRQFWVHPQGYTEAAPKAVRPAAEALLRLAGRLQNGTGKHVVTDIQLGYYANRSMTAIENEGIIGWDTVPVWRISLDNNDVYYINAFNGEWES